MRHVPVLIALMLAMVALGCSPAANKQAGNSGPAEGAGADSGDSGGEVSSDEGGDNGDVDNGDPSDVAVFIDPTTHEAALGVDAAELTITATEAESGEPVTIRFQEWGGVVKWDPEEMRPAGVEVEITSESVWAQPKKHDELLQSADGLNWQEFPEIAFRSTSVEPVEGRSDEVQVTGTLEYLGQTKELTFPARFSTRRNIFLDVEATLQLLQSELGLAADAFEDQFVVRMQVGMEGKTKGGDLYSLDRRPDLDAKKKPADGDQGGGEKKGEAEEGETE